MTEAVLVGKNVVDAPPVQAARPRKRRRPSPFAFLVGSAVFWLAVWWVAAAL